MTNERDILFSFLRSKGLKLTNQRMLILQTFIKVERHLSVEDLYGIVRKKDPAIGHATVFRTLKLFCDAGIANEVDLGDKRVRYEHSYGHQHHDHLVCTKCGKFFEVVDQRIERLQNELCKREGFLPKKHKMEIFGICKRCQKKAK